MKSVQSHILSSNPISLSDATSFLSDFTTSVCGVYSDRASQETRVFIRRALVSFQELDRLHRKLKDRRSDRNRRPTGSDTQNDDAETTTVQAQSLAASRDVSSRHRYQESDVISKGEIKEEDGGGIGEKRKKKKKSKKVEGEIKEEDGESKMGSEEVKKEEEKKKERKSGESDGVEEQHEKRKKRRNRGVSMRS